MFPFYTSWKHQKTIGFLVFSGDIKWEHWPEMGSPISCLSRFLYLLKTWENVRCSDVFRGYRKRTVAWSRLMDWHLKKGLFRKSFIVSLMYYFKSPNLLMGNDTVILHESSLFSCSLNLLFKLFKISGCYLLSISNNFEIHM